MLSGAATHAPQSSGQEEQEGSGDAVAIASQRVSYQTSDGREPGACGLKVCYRRACCCGKHARSDCQGGASQRSRRQGNLRLLYK